MHPKVRRFLGAYFMRIKHGKNKVYSDELKIDVIKDIREELIVKSNGYNQFILENIEFFCYNVNIQ